MPPRSYSSYKGKGASGRKEASDYVAVGPALDDYEKTLRDNPGSGSTGPWLFNVINDFFGTGKPQNSIKNALEEGEDAPVIGPAIGAVGRFFDVLSRGNYAAANVGELAQERDDIGFVPDILERTALATLLPGFGHFLNANFKEGSTLDQFQSVGDTGYNTAKALLGGGIARDVANVVQGNSGPTYTGRFIEGITGTRKNSFGEVLEKEGVTNPAIRSIGGLGLDVLLDPTSYVGTGVVKGMNPGDEAADLLRVITRTPNVPPELSQFENLAINSPWPRPPAPVVKPPVNWMVSGQGLPPMSQIETLPSQFRPETVAGVGADVTSPGIVPNTGFSPVESVVDGPVSDPSTGEILEQGNLFDVIPEPQTRVFNEIQGTQTNLFDRRRRGVKGALEGVDLTAKIPPRQVEDVLGGQLPMQFPDPPQEIEWLQLFDPDSPQTYKKVFEPERGVELLTDTTPEELAALTDAPPATAGEDWEVTKIDYEPDGPVDIPIEELATNSVEGLNKAPYEVIGSVRHSDEIPMHREFLTKSEDGPRLAGTAKVDVNAVLPGFDDVPPAWRGDGGFDLGKLPDAPKNAGKG